MRQQLAGAAFGVMISAAVFLGLWQPWEDDIAPAASVPTQTAAEKREERCELYLDRILEANRGEWQVVTRVMFTLAEDAGCVPR